MCTNAQTDHWSRRPLAAHVLCTPTDMQSECLWLAIAVSLLLIKKKVCSVYKPNALHRQLTRAALGHVQDAEQYRLKTLHATKELVSARGHLCAPTTHTHRSTNIPEQSIHLVLCRHPHTHIHTHTHTLAHTRARTFQTEKLTSSDVGQHS
jgi:hypothetical protein